VSDAPRADAHALFIYVTRTPRGLVPAGSAFASSRSAADARSVNRGLPLIRARLKVRYKSIAYKMCQSACNLHSIWAAWPYLELLFTAFVLLITYDLCMRSVDLISLSRKFNRTFRYAHLVA
jgi:hypothetical protein